MKDIQFRSYMREVKEYKKHNFFAKWLNTFAHQLTEEHYQQRVRGQYVWHVFSFELIDKSSFLQKDAARKAYDAVDKKGARCISLWWEEDELRALPHNLDNARNIEMSDISNSEFYVVGANFEWTYVVTHETACGLGPYFMSLKNNA